MAASSARCRASRRCAYLTRGLGTEWEIRKVGFKPYATAASVQSVLFAIDGLMAENSLDRDDIERVVIHCSTMAHRHCAWPYEPSGVTAAQMNMFFAAAMMIIDRNAMLDQFREDRLTDPAALAMIERIAIEADPKYDAGGDATRHHARVELIAKDGRRLRPRGAGAARQSRQSAVAGAARARNSRRSPPPCCRPSASRRSSPPSPRSKATDARTLTGLATTAP